MLDMNNMFHSLYFLFNNRIGLVLNKDIPFLCHKRSRLAEEEQSM